MKKRILVHTEHPRYGDLGTPMYVDVLSSNDFQSFRTRQQDIQFRLLAELNNIENKDSSFHFVTLTYDDAHLPRVHQVNTFFKLSDPDEFGKTTVLDEYIEDKIINVALTRDLQTFNKRLRINIERHLSSDLGFKFKYLLCHEYGRQDDYLDDFGRLRTATERAHYHGIYVCTPAVSESVFQQLVDQSWKKGRTLNPLLEGDDIFQAISYTSKYVSKSLTLTSAKFRPEYKDYTLVNSKYFSIDSPTCPSREVLINEINPRVLTSKNLGACYVHENNDLSLPLREDLFLKGQHTLKLNKDNECINIPLPRYYFQKYCKDNAEYVELVPEYQLSEYEGIIEQRDYFEVSGSIHSKLNHYHVFADGYKELVKTKSVSSDSKFFQNFKSILADNTAARKTAAFLDYFYANPSFSKYFSPDYFKIKFYFRNRFSLMPFDEFRPHTLPPGSKHLFYDMYGSSSLPMPIKIERYALLQEIDPYYQQLEMLINAYEKTQESRRCARNAIREFEQRRRIRESHDRKLHRGHWRRSVS